jgi:hypothetical protein
MLCPVIMGAKGAVVTNLQQGVPSAPPAGWYPDPVRPGSTRYWSGTGWTDQVSAPATEPAFALASDLGPVVEPPPITFTAPPAPRESHATQSDWHQTRAKPIQRVKVAPVSTTTPLASGSARPHNDPYDRNWIAGVAIVLAVLSIPGLAARALWELPPLTLSIIAGAPIGVSLLAFARAARHRSGRVLSIVAVVISAATLAAAFLIPPAVLEEMVGSIVGLLP